MSKERNLLRWKWIPYTILGIFFFVILILRGCSSNKKDSKKEEKNSVATSTTNHQHSKKVLQIYHVKYDKSRWAHISLVKARDMCPRYWHVAFRFGPASQPYIVKNMSGNLLYSQGGEDISSQLGYTNENLYLYFKAQKEPGILKVEIYAYK